MMKTVLAVAVATTMASRIAAGHIR